MPGMTEGIDRARLDELLVTASRTFAINIPLLPGILRDALTLGYLFLRNADTIEDAYRWPKQKRLDDLDALHEIMLDPNPEDIERFMDRYQHVEGVDNLDYVELLRLTPYLFDQLAILPAAYGQEIRLHVARVIRRMQRFIKKHDDENRLHLRRLQELDDYCYAVAGIVGELITALISLYRPTLDRTRLLFMRSFETACGAGLQLTNILKDVFRDHLEGRYYIPQEYLPFQNGGGSDQILPIIAHAYRNLCLGRDYACALPEEEVDIRRAILVPFFLALATLEHLLRNLEALFQGDEVKISREKVVEILILTEQVVEENQAIEAAWDELGGGLRQIDLSSLLSQQMRLGRGV